LSDEQHLLVQEHFFFWYSAAHSRSVTPIAWQAAVDDEEQRPLLQDIFEAAVDGHHVCGKKPSWFPVAFLAVFTFEYPSPG